MIKLPHPLYQGGFELVGNFNDGPAPFWITSFSIFYAGLTPFIIDRNIHMFEFFIAEPLIGLFSLASSKP